MTTKAGVGTSHHHNPNVAGREAAQQALKEAGLERPDFLFMFASIGYGSTRGKLLFREQEKQEILRRFRRSVDPDVPWAGFYTIGEIGPVEEHNDRHLYTSVVLALN
jgi:FIST C domain